MYLKKIIILYYEIYIVKHTLVGLWLNNKSFNNDLSRSIAVGG